jgi:hypothetical protein
VGPGNFFAHALIAELSLFTTIPPIFYWKSSFWRKEDKQTRTILEQLTDLPDPELDFDEMWHFLGREGYLEKLFKMMCAVVDGVKSHRRVIIIDSNEHVALWVAAISCMLPPAYRSLLSFTTYHHDPYQSQFFITGTPPSAQFHLSPNDYTSYFVLNIPENKISDIDETLAENSLYAQLVRNFAAPEKYESEMLDFFSKYASRFPHPTALDEQLNLIALYARIMREDGSVSLTENKRKAIIGSCPHLNSSKTIPLKISMISSIWVISYGRHMKRPATLKFKRFISVSLSYRNCIKFPLKRLSKSRSHTIPNNFLRMMPLAHGSLQATLSDNSVRNMEKLYLSIRLTCQLISKVLLG